jgi:uncharacterized protein (DUF302 family)
MNTHDDISAIATRTASGSVADCRARLHSAVKARRPTVFAEFDHSGAASAHGLDLRETALAVSATRRPERQ